MKNRQQTLLLHPFFILSILLLLLNDFYLKYQFNNWLTGKLSDFAGLFAFTVFLFTLFSNYKKPVIIFVSVFFLWWKSPLSDFIINVFNYRLNIPLRRVRDYTDLMALISLPLTIYIKPLGRIKLLVRKFATFCMGIISFIAFTATSLPRRLADDNKVLLEKYFKTKKKEDIIIRDLKNHGLLPLKTPIYERMWDSYYLKLKNSDTMVHADSFYSGVYRKINYGSTYIIPKIYINEDSIFNLQFVISEFNPRSQIRLYSFEYKNNDSNFYSSYYIYRKLKKPIKKKIKEILRD